MVNMTLEGHPVRVAPPALDAGLINTFLKIGLKRRESVAAADEATLRCGFCGAMSACRDGQGRWCVSSGWRTFYISDVHFPVELVYLVEKGGIPATVSIAWARFSEIQFRVSAGGARAMRGAEVTRRISRSEVPELPDRVIAATVLALQFRLITRDCRIRRARIQTIWCSALHHEFGAFFRVAGGDLVERRLQIFHYYGGHYYGWHYCGGKGGGHYCGGHYCGGHCYGGKGGGPGKLPVSSRLSLRSQATSRRGVLGVPVAAARRSAGSGLSPSVRRCNRSASKAVGWCPWSPP